MALLTGRATFLRFRAPGPKPAFGDDALDKLRAFAAGRQAIASADGLEIGWSAGDHELDTHFTPEKNVVGDVLHFELRVDTDKPPAGLERAYFLTELAGLMSENASASARQKREAKEAARDRLEQEAKDGRFKKRKCVQVLWDGTTNEVLFGATSISHVDRFVGLFKETFGVELEIVTAGKMLTMFDDPTPSAFVPGTGDDIAWIDDDASRDYLGNEFLLWLWYTSDGDTDTVKIPDGSEVTFMLARTLTLECPRGQTGHETISSDGPTRLPEARRAVQSGKLPRKAGITLVRHDHQYELTLHAETLAVGSAKLPAPEEESVNAKLHERVGNLRHMIETIDGLYSAFLRVRLSSQWSEVLTRMQTWLGRGERSAA